MEKFKCKRDKKFREKKETRLSLNYPKSNTRCTTKSKRPELTEAEGLSYYSGYHNVKILWF